MPSKTDSFVRLYRIDQQIRSLSGRLKTAQAYLNRVDHELRTLSAKRDALRKKMKDLATLEAGLESEAESIEARINHLREQMNSARTNKEYVTFQSELSTFKAEKDKIETDALTKLGEVDTVREELARTEAETAEREKIREVAVKDVEARQKEIGSRLDELESDRRKAASEVDQEAMAIYRDFWENDDEPMAEIIEEDRRRHEYCCGECNMSLPVQAVNRVLGTGTVTTCSSCGRILFAGEELRDRFRS